MEYLAIIVAALKAGGEIKTFIMDQLALANQNGTITDEQLAKVKAAAGLSDTDWDNEVAAAKSRIGA